jgi:DNA-binding transcriptional LysR family regulator
MIRSTRGIELTAAGRAFIEHAPGALFQLPDLAAGMLRSKLDVAFLRPEALLSKIEALKFSVLHRP